MGFVEWTRWIYTHKGCKKQCLCCNQFKISMKYIWFDCLKKVVHVICGYLDPRKIATSFVYLQNGFSWFGAKMLLYLWIGVQTHGETYVPTFVISLGVWFVEFHWSYLTLFHAHQLKAWGLLYLTKDILSVLLYSNLGALPMIHQLVI